MKLVNDSNSSADGCQSHRQAANVYIVIPRLFSPKVFTLFHGVLHSTIDRVFTTKTNAITRL